MTTAELLNSTAIPPDPEADNGVPSDAKHLLFGARAIANWFGKPAKWFYKQVERRTDRDSRLPVWKIDGKEWVADTRDLVAWVRLQRMKAGGNPD